MNYLHNIPVRLYDNPLTEEQGDLFARVEINKTLDTAAVCHSACERAHFPFDEAAMLMCVRKFFDEMGCLLGDGFAINTEWFHAALHVKGAFTGVNDHFDPQRHRIVAEFQEGAKMRKYAEDNATIVIKGMAEASALITQVKDTATGAIDSQITAGSAIVITGRKIKLAGDDASVGVWFSHVDDDWTEKVAAQFIISSEPSKLIVQIPPHFLPHEQMRLTIRTQYSANTARLLNEPRVITYDKILTTRAA